MTPARIAVAFVTNWLGMGGTEKGMVNHALAIDRDRFDVRVVAARGDGERRAALEAAGIPVHVADGDEATLARQLEGVDVVHVFRAGLAEDLVPAACRRAGVSHLVETNIFGAFDASEDESQFDVHCFVGKMCALRYRDAHGPAGPAFHARHRVLHWPVDIDGLQALAPPRAEAKAVLGLDPQRPVVGRIGRDDDRKWRRLLVDMVPHLLELAPTAQVLVVGATPAKVRRLRRLGVLAACDLLEPTLDERALATRFAACDVFVTAAEIGESYSVAICEAMALGIPVVTSSTPWVDNGQIEQVDEGETGHVADHPRAFAEAVASLVEDPERAERFGAAGAAKMRRLVDAPALTRQLESLFEGLVADGAPPAEWAPSPPEVDAFASDYERRLRASFRPLTSRERLEVRLDRYRERLGWLVRAARQVDRERLRFVYWTLRGKLRGARGG